MIPTFIWCFLLTGQCFTLPIYKAISLLLTFLIIVGWYRGSLPYTATFLVLFDVTYRLYTKFLVATGMLIWSPWSSIAVMFATSRRNTSLFTFLYRLSIGPEWCLTKLCHRKSLLMKRVPRVKPPLPALHVISHPARARGSVAFFAAPRKLASLSPGLFVLSSSIF